MIQRISVRIRVINDDKILLLRRSDGRESILGKYELPGGRVREDEQPIDAARRFLADDLGISGTVHLQLEDAITFMDSDDRTIQYAVIVYRTVISAKRRAVKISDHYDKYIWYNYGKIDETAITEVSKLAMGSLFFSTKTNQSSDSDTAVEVKDLPIIIYTDGGSRGNPGPSAAGYILTKGGAVIDQGGGYLGVTTNNQAEYQAAVMGMEAAIKLGAEVAELRLDSLLVANQLKGIYKVRNRELWPINDRAKEMIAKFKKITITHIPREMNHLADGMVNRILDEQEGVV